MCALCPKKVFFTEKMLKKHRKDNHSGPANLTKLEPQMERQEIVLPVVTHSKIHVYHQADAIHMIPQRP